MSKVISSLDEIGSEKESLKKTLSLIEELDTTTTKCSCSVVSEIEVQVLTEKN